MKGAVAEGADSSQETKPGRMKNIHPTVAIAESYHDAYTKQYGVMEHGPFYSGRFKRKLLPTIERTDYEEVS